MISSLVVKYLSAFKMLVALFIIKGVEKGYCKVVKSFACHDGMSICEFEDLLRPSLQTQLYLCVRNCISESEMETVKMCVCIQ